MKLDRLGQHARLAFGFRKFAHARVDHRRAVAEVGARLADRERIFLATAQRLIYDIPWSPLRRLLLWAGCEHGDLARSVAGHGIEGTLARLRDAGVYVRLDEFKSRGPICRPGLTMATAPRDFNNPFSRGIQGTTSGSRGPRTSATYNWEFLAEESSHELLLQHAHGLQDAPTALWYPTLPGVAGLHNLLLQAKHGRVPQRWFSQSPTRWSQISLEAFLTQQVVHWGGRLSGVRLPRPEFTPLAAAPRVVEWIASAARLHGTSVLKTFASCAVRIAQTARERGVELRASVVFTGGEPLTDVRRRFCESVGLKVFPRYVATEAGLIAAACPGRTATDDMHVYTDRVAVIGMEARDTGGRPSLLVTSLLPHTPKVMLNTELGDCGTLATRRCACVLGDVGFDRHLSSVRSHEKITLEGVAVLTAEVDAAIAQALEAQGAPPDCYQFWEAQSGQGVGRLVIAVSPDVGGLDEGKLVGDVLRALRREGGGLAPRFWNEAGTLDVIRERPRLSGGHKMLSRAPMP